MENLKYCLSEDTFSEYHSPQLRLKTITQRWERDQYFALRMQVFGAEQRLFSHSDLDNRDFQATGIIALSHNWGMPDQVVGGVRIYQDNEVSCVDTWYGGRLCVSKPYRANHHLKLGTALINEAVSHAKEQGCSRFLANIQPQNEHYFRKLHWRRLGQVYVQGKSHVLMEADLNQYPFMPREGLAS